jgi:hypothetical protein
MTKCLKPHFCKLKKQQCMRRRGICWAQHVDTQVDWPNSFWDMTKWLKPHFCKLKKKLCIRSRATCWAQRVDTQVDWPNSFWDMTECLKPHFCKLKKQQSWSWSQKIKLILISKTTIKLILISKNKVDLECIRRRAICWANALTVWSICPIVSEIWQNV